MIVFTTHPHTHLKLDSDHKLRDIDRTQTHAGRQKFGSSARTTQENGICCCMYSLNLSRFVLIGGYQLRTLPALRFSYKAFEPVFSETLMKVHHAEHFEAYRAKTNTALQALPESLQSKSLDALLMKLDEIPEAQRTAMRNFGGGFINHDLFFKTLTTPDKVAPLSESTELHQALTAQFGSLDEFRKQFIATSTSLFGSGWTFAYLDLQNKIKIANYANQDTPLMELGKNAGGRPFMLIDLWEHAYHMQYHSNRASYVQACWGLLDWAQVSNEFTKAKSETASKL